MADRKTPDFIVHFEQTGSLRTVGGKGANLIRLAEFGVPVPRGFVISTSAYEAFVKSNSLDQVLSASLAEVKRGQSLSGTSGRIRAAFGHGEFPPQLVQQIAEAYRELCRNSGANDLSVAVRSSATAEDLAQASFAGQQDTYLNVRGERELLNAIRRCFGSLWNERAIDYRARQRMAPLSAQLAVVVQRMIYAEAAGVLFTVDPVSGDSNQMVIDAVYGLGESLVSGLVTPDHIVLEKRSGSVLSYSVAAKSVMIISAKNGTKQKAVPWWKQRSPVLANKQVKALYHLGQTIEAFYGHPQDLEWCWAGGELYLVQARPITTLPARPVNWDVPGPGKWLHGGGSLEMITEPISPLFETFSLPIFFQAAIKLLDDAGLHGLLPAVPYRVVNGHIYLNMAIRLRPWHLVGVIKDFAMHLNSMEAQECEETLYRETVKRLDEPAVSSLTSEQMLSRMHSLGEAAARYWIQITKLVQAIYRAERAFVNFYTRRVRRSSDAEPEIFLRGQVIKPWEAECSTFDLAQLAQKHPTVAHELKKASEVTLENLARMPEAAEFLSALHSHLDDYGHQLSSLDFSLPTLADDPRAVLTAIQAFLEGKESPYARQQRMSVEREQAIAAVLSHLSPRIRRTFIRLLEAAQHAARMRENALFDLGLAWTRMHRCALELGRRLSQTGVLAQSSDVFWLTLEEIRAVLLAAESQTAKVDQRKADNHAWRAVNAPYLLPIGSKPALWWRWVFPTPELQVRPDARTLVGLGVSPGKVTAVARVLHSLDDMDKLGAGEILVAHATTPAWTPLFARAAGLVTDLGGPLAHGSIVARELGIPAVMGTGNATQKILNGQEVTVLGAEGKVLLHPNQATLR